MSEIIRDWRVLLIMKSIQGITTFSDIEKVFIYLTYA